MEDGVPAYGYNFRGIDRFRIAGKAPLPTGPATLRFNFAYDGGGTGRGGLGQLYVSGDLAGEGRIGRTQPMVFSADETADVGIDLQTPVAAAFAGGKYTRFTDRITEVTVATARGRLTGAATGGRLIGSRSALRPEGGDNVGQLAPEQGRGRRSGRRWGCRSKRSACRRDRSASSRPWRRWRWWQGPAGRCDRLSRRRSFHSRSPRAAPSPADILPGDNCRSRPGCRPAHACHPRPPRPVGQDQGNGR